MHSVIITAAGKGQRMNASLAKQYIKLGGRPVLSYSINTFASVKDISEIILVIPESDKSFVQNEILPFCHLSGERKIKIAFGGEKRQNSVYNGILKVKNKNGIVLIHDGARPFVTQELISACIKKAIEKKAVILATPATDTLKRAENQRIVKTVKREKIWQAQTPQAFYYPLILKVHIKAKEDNIYKTDDAALVEHFKEKVYIVEGSRFNIKLTTPEDLKWAKSYLAYSSS